MTQSYRGLNISQPVAPVIYIDARGCFFITVGREVQSYNMIEEIIQKGVQPLQLSFEPLHYFDRDSYIVRSFMKVESLDLGTLDYNQYRFVARRTKLGNKLIARHIEKLFREYPTIMNSNKIEVISFPVTAKFLLSGEFAPLLFNLQNYFGGITAEKVCVEISSDVLFEDTNLVKEKIEELREMGFKIAIFEVGDEYCPVFKLAEIPFNYAFVDKYVVDSLKSKDAERVAGGIVQFLKHLNVKIFAPAIENKGDIAIAEKLGFDGFGLPSELPEERGSGK